MGNPGRNLEQKKARAEMIGENGGWYRDRTCDPYHVKVTPSVYPVEKSKRTNEFVRETFATGSHQSWAILGQSWAQNTPGPKGGAPAAK